MLMIDAYDHVIVYNYLTQVYKMTHALIYLRRKVSKINH